LTFSSVQDLVSVTQNQPAWSDFPLIVLTSSGEVSGRSLKRKALHDQFANVHRLERPVRPETLISTVKNALRARQRQFQIRDQFDQQARAEEALRKSEKLAVAGRLATTIAHEINNPLEAVTNLLYLVRTSDSLQEIRSYVLLAEQELKRVSEISTQTLKFYRQPTAPSNTSVPEVLDSVLALYNRRLISSGIEVRQHYEAVKPLKALSGELRQLFANLIINSADAMPSGGTLFVRVRQAFEQSKSRRQGLRITIADTGTGIPSNVRKKVFEPFVTTKEAHGTGLGLWVSAQIVAKHGGTIKMKSCTQQPRTGTIFSIFLPSQFLTA
jgi:signal transduction histidine kinase